MSFCDLFLRSEAESANDVVLYFPHPVVVSGQDWSFFIGRAAPPTLGDAGPNQPLFLGLLALGYDWVWMSDDFVEVVLGHAGLDQEIVTATILLNHDFTFIIPLSALLDLGLEIVLFNADEPSLLSLNNIVGREGGTVQFLGAGPDTLYITYRGHKRDVDTLLSLPPTYGVKFVRHGQVWWMGMAVRAAVSNPVLEASAASDLLSVTLTLRGVQGAVEGGAVGSFCGGETYPPLTGTVFVNQDWSFSLPMEEYEQ